MRKLMLFAGLLLASMGVHAGGAGVQSFSLSGHGEFVLHVPANWKSEVYQPEGGLPPTITLRPKSGAEFRVMVTPIWPARPDVKPMTGADMERGVREAADKAAPRSVEKTLPVKPLRGSGNLGYYFSATDSRPGPGEFTIMNQGVIQVGGLAVTFTILTNSGQQKVVDRALSMLVHSSHRRR